MEGQRVDAGIDAQVEVTQLRDTGYWQRLKEWHQGIQSSALKEYAAVCRIVLYPASKPASEVESRTLVQAKRRAETNGFL